jgi:ergothioneine biosynthesis protein EgtB
LVGQNDTKWSGLQTIPSHEGRHIVSTTTRCTPEIEIGARFREARQSTLALCAPLTPEDMMVQSSADASPVKWHLAHTTWFFETFILREFMPGYRLFNSDFPWLFNSYYQNLGPFPEKRLRSSFSRPGLDEIWRYREHVDESIDRLLERNPDPEALKRIVLGVNHEEQHQELLLTDILNAFFTNPLRPAYQEKAEEEETSNSKLKRQANHQKALDFQPFEGGLREIGYDGGGFCFDNEQPRHRVWLEPYSLARRLVTCGEFAEFIADGGYRRPELWLSDGWRAVQQEGWQAPLYWTHENGEWSVFTLRGLRPLALVGSAPVSQVSYFEADAFARWAERRLPTEFEWEAAAEGQTIGGNLLESGLLMPRQAPELGAESARPAEGFASIFGDCWQWTASAYLGYPGYQPLAGALGEYNGKFMSGNMVLRGGSCVTPAAHVRASYRNFFSPESRWQFSGIRLAF